MDMMATFGTTEIARLCGVSPSTAATWIDDNKISSHHTVGGHRRVLARDLLAFLKQYNFPIPAELQRQKPVVLVVDDDPLSRLMMSRVVRRARPDVEVVEAVDGFEAGHKAGGHKPDLVLLDLKLPGMDGGRVCEILRQDHRFKGVRILAMSVSADEKARKDVLDKGADGFLLKNADVHGMARQVAEFLPKPAAV